VGVSSVIDVDASTLTSAWVVQVTSADPQVTR